MPLLGNVLSERNSQMIAPNQPKNRSTREQKSTEIVSSNQPNNRSKSEQKSTENISSNQPQNPSCTLSDGEEPVGKINELNSVMFRKYFNFIKYEEEAFNMAATCKFCDTNFKHRTVWGYKGATSNLEVSQFLLIRRFGFFFVFSSFVK